MIACHSTSAGTSGGAVPPGMMTGGSSPEDAVNAYIAAVKARDLQAMSAIWGTERGPARETMERVQMERSETIVMGLFCTDEEARVTRKASGTGTRQILTVELKRKSATVSTNFTTIPGPRNRWYVEDVDLGSDKPKRMQALCH